MAHRVIDHPSTKYKCAIAPLPGGRRWAWRATWQVPPPPPGKYPDLFQLGPAVIVGSGTARSRKSAERKAERACSRHKQEEAERAARRMSKNAREWHPWI